MADETDSILDRLRDVLRDGAVEDLDWDAVAADTSIEALGFDSLTILDLLYDVEEEFGVALEPKQVARIRTVGEIVDLLREQGA